MTPDSRIGPVSAKVEIREARTAEDLALVRALFEELEAASFFGDRGRPPEYVETLLSGERIAQDGLFDPGAVGKLVQKVKNGHAIGIRDNMALVGILSTQVLIEKFVRNFERCCVHA